MDYPVWGFIFIFLNFQKNITIVYNSKTCIVLIATTKIIFHNVRLIFKPGKNKINPFYVQTFNIFALERINS